MSLSIEKVYQQSTSTKSGVCEGNAGMNDA